MKKLSIWGCGLFMAGMAALAASQAQAQAVSDTVLVDVRTGAKVNVRGTPAIQDGNIVGEARGGNRAVVLEVSPGSPHNWYRLLDLDRQFEGWIRGDLLSVVTGQGEGGEEAVQAGNVAAPQAPVAPTGPAPAEPPQSVLRDRPAWLASIRDYLPAARSCVETGSAQPALAANILVLPRGLIEVTILDAADRQWKCVIREGGGTPLRFDPVFGGEFGDRDHGAFFASVVTGRPAKRACQEVEPVVEGQREILQGWLIYTDCS